MTQTPSHRLVPVEATEEQSQEHAPGCSQPEPEMGFGLAGGGYGPYTYCPECGVILWKTEDHT